MPTGPRLVYRASAIIPTFGAIGCGLPGSFFFLGGLIVTYGLLPGARPRTPEPVVWVIGLPATCLAVWFLIQAWRSARLEAMVFDPAERAVRVTHFDRQGLIGRLLPGEAFPSLAMHRIERIPFEAFQEVEITEAYGWSSRTVTASSGPTTTWEKDKDPHYRLTANYAEGSLELEAFPSSSKAEARGKELAALLGVPLAQGGERDLAAEARDKWFGSRPLSVPSQFRNLVTAALIDGHLDTAEVALLNEHARRLGIEAGAAQAIVRAIAATKKRAFVTPRGEEGKRSAFEEVVAMLRADGEVRPQERLVIERLGEAYGIPRTDVARALAEAP